MGWSVKSALRAQAERAACPPTSHSLVDASEQRVDCSPLHLFVALAVAVVVILYLRHIFNWHEDMVGAFLALFKATQGLPSATRACAREREQERLRERECVCVSFFVCLCMCVSVNKTGGYTHAHMRFCGYVGLSVLIVLRLITYFFGQKAKDYPLAQVQSPPQDRNRERERERSKPRRTATQIHTDTHSHALTHTHSKALKHTHTHTHTHTIAFFAALRFPWQ